MSFIQQSTKQIIHTSVMKKSGIFLCSCRLTRCGQDRDDNNQFAAISWLIAVPERSAWFAKGRCQSVRNVNAYKLTVHWPGL